MQDGIPFFPCSIGAARAKSAPATTPVCPLASAVDIEHRVQGGAAALTDCTSVGMSLLYTVSPERGGHEKFQKYCTFCLRICNNVTPEQCSLT